MRHLMDVTGGGITGHFAFHLYQAANDRPEDPPMVMEIVTPETSVTDYLRLLERMGWSHLITANTKDGSSPFAELVHVYVKVSDSSVQGYGSMITITGVQGKCVIPYVLSAHASILCCLVTPAKVECFCSIVQGDGAYTINR